MTTLEGNKIIAEFMGLTIEGFPNQTLSKWWVDKKNPSSLYHNSSESDIKFHSSWDWLMPVVDKIAAVAAYYSGDSSEIYDKCEIVLSLHVCVSITTVWEKVIAFIQWYNTQSK